MDGILGQDRAVDVLATQLQSGRLHHAYIFRGPAGIGKFTTALAFGQVLLCHSKQQDLAGRVVACGSCASCKFFDAQSEHAQQAGDADSDEPAALGSAHPDLHVVTKELARYSDDALVRNRKLTSIPVDVLRVALIEPVYRAAQMNRGKVFIVDEAELLNQAGQNLLLKTLEEPPAGTTIILVTSSEDRLLPTIRSRCQRIAFVPLTDELVEQWIQQQQPGLSPDERQWLVGFAGGSFGRASLALSYNLTEWARAILPRIDDIAQRRTRGELGSEIESRIKAFAEKWVDQHAGASKEAANKLAADLMWSLIATHARQRVAAMADQCDPADPEQAEHAIEPWLGVIDAVHEAAGLLATNVNMSLVCDHLVSVITRQLIGGRR